MSEIYWGPIEKLLHELWQIPFWRMTMFWASVFILIACVIGLFLPFFVDMTIEEEEVEK